MKKVMEKVIFMAVGSLLTIIGYHFGTVDNNSANAQLDENPFRPNGVFNAIACRALAITDANGTPRIILGVDDDSQAGVIIVDENQKPQVSLRASDKDSHLSIFHTNEIVPQISLVGSDRGGEMIKGGKRIALKADNGGGGPKEGILTPEVLEEMLRDWQRGQQGITIETAVQATIERINLLKTKLGSDETTIIEMQQDIIKVLSGQFKLDSSTISKMVQGVLNAAKKLEEKHKLDKHFISQMQFHIIKVLQEKFKLDVSATMQMQEDVNAALDKELKFDESAIKQLQEDIIEALKKPLKKTEPVE